MSPDPHPNAPGDGARRLRSRVMRPLAERYPGRDELIELVALALCASENLLVVGPPGTAKSAIIADFARRISGRYFEYLLTRFTEPSEIFGPVDIARLREGELVTRTEGVLPEAEIVFLDEVFNAGSAILNALLGIINDGIYRRGKERRPTDIISVIGAANRLTEDPQLRALEDRFTLRVAVELIGDDRLRDLLVAGWEIERERMANEEAAPPAGFTTADLRALRKEVASVRLDGVVGSISALVRRMRAAGMFLSDRRAVKLQRLAASSAVLSGRRDAIASDLWVARHVWETLEDREEVEEIVDDVLASARDASDIGGRDHPLAFRGPGAAELLAAVARLEDELTRLRGIEHRREPSKLRDRLQDLDREVRWCRPRGPEDEHRLREAETRLGSLSESLARGDSGT